MVVGIIAIVAAILAAAIVVAAVITHNYLLIRRLSFSLIQFNSMSLLACFIFDIIIIIMSGEVSSI